MSNNTHRPEERLFLGLDIGSVNARIALVDAAGTVVYSDSERISTGPSVAVAALFDRLLGFVPREAVAGAAVCGSGRQSFRGVGGWQVVSSPYAAIMGVLAQRPDARTIVEIGGQSAFVVGLEDGLNKPWRVARTPLCAAGTGRFLEQQCQRLGISVAEFGAKALEWEEAPPRIAARCSVFAKSDLIHLQQKGWPVSAMLAGLSDSVARMIVAQWRDSFAAPIVVIGGVAANEGVVRALARMLNSENVIVPPEPALVEAVGAALIARSTPSSGRVDLSPGLNGEEKSFHVPTRLTPYASPDGWQPAEFAVGSKPVDVYLGVDVGSTSTKAAVISPSGEVLAKTYLMTAGQPLEAVKQVMANLAHLENKVRVRAVGVTGSGRYLVGNFIGADLIKNEITAQVAAAVHIDPSVDTVFELGGQDSKYVYLENGTALDYQMNKACAAGTGSFIDELAEQLGISTRTGEFARLAFSAETQLDLGERCAAFMSQAVTSAQQAGEPLEVVVASLAASLAKNYRSKVVGTGRVGKRIFLTGAVFYNEAVVAAFKAEYPDKTFIVPDHKEVTGAIGAALLARESSVEGEVSAFKGFSAIAAAEYELTNFTCQHCENSCAISVMKTDDGNRLYYGSRCDRYDAAGGRSAKVRTPFTEREELLFASYREDKGTGPVVGVPRALMTMDLAPLLTGFLNELGVRVRYSSPTNKRLIEMSVERAYTDSCFPVKLLHGHVAELLEGGADYIMIPNAIRMGLKSGEADQRYSCPLVQAAPYIIRSVFGLGDKLLDPIIDLSLGDAKVIESFADLAQRLGFDRAKGRAAAVKALGEQRHFEAQLQAAGERVLAEIDRDPDAVGVVLLSRSYNAQDSGANLGMAQELAKLGVVPVPLDFLPLDSVDVSEISDRPYWNYERKLLAAAKIVAENPRLFGLFLSNFGCGPNSIIENVVQDIMGGKPLGQIEVDEHAAEAGYVTRLEALVDTIRGYMKAKRHSTVPPERYARWVPSSVRSGENVIIVRMADHAAVVAAAMQAYGVNAMVAAESDERSLALSRDVTSGKECLPFRDTLGVLLRMAEDNDLPPNARALMAGSFGPCRLGKYALEQQKILRERGIGIQIMTTVSNNAYADLGLGTQFQLLAWQGIVATDYLQRLLWMTRPYEREKGASEEAYTRYLNDLVAAIRQRRPFSALLKRATQEFASLRDPAIPRRPLVGINGEIYLRANRFCNKDLVAVCEANGLEAEVAPMAEWLKYTAFRNVEDAWINRSILKVISGELRQLAMGFYEKRIAAPFATLLHEPEPSTADLLRASAPLLPPRNGSEAVLSLGSGIRQMRDPHFAGVISVMPHGCMPGGIVAALSEQISKENGHKPWISLTFDGFPDKVNPERIADFAEQVRHQRRSGA